MKKLFIGLMVAFSLSGCSQKSEDDGYIYSLNERIHQYHIYDAVTKRIIFNTAFELKYDYDTEEYFMIIPVTAKDIITDETVFTEYSFKKDEVIIIDADSGSQIIPGSIK